jgi:hypothetical protein
MNGEYNGMEGCQMGQQAKGDRRRKRGIIGPELSSQGICM